MADIQYNITMPGADKVIAQLREINQLNDRIQRRGPNNNAIVTPVNRQVGANATNKIIAGGNSPIASGVTGALAGAAAGNSIAKSTNGTFKELFSKMGDGKMWDDFKEATKTLNSLTPAALAKALSDGMVLNQQQMLGGGKINDVKGFNDTLRAAHTAFTAAQSNKPKDTHPDAHLSAEEWRRKVIARRDNSNLPPVVSNASILKSQFMANLKKGGIGDTIFGGWKAGIAAKNGGGGGGLATQMGGGLFGGGGAGAIGSVLGSFGPFKLGLIAITTAMLALRYAIKLLEEGIQHGAKAYQEAAKLGKDVSGTFALASAFKSIGMETPDLSVLQGEYNKKSEKYEAPGTDVVLGAARAGQFGNMQQLLNMSEEFRIAMKDAADNARQMGAAARVTQELNSKISAVSREWSTMLTQLATVFSPIIDYIANAIKIVLTGANMVLEQIIKLEQKLHIISPGGDDFKRHQGGNGSGAPGVTPWEKIGFVIGQPKQDAMVQVSHNTSLMVGILRNIAIGLMNAPRRDNDLGTFRLTSLP